MKNFCFVIIAFLLSGCLETSQDFNAWENFPSHKLSPYVLWQTVQGSASLKGLPPSTILSIARRTQNLFATGHIGQQVSWEEGDIKSEIMIIDIPHSLPVPCLKYRQTLRTAQEIRHSEGTACKDTLNIWRIVEEMPLGPVRQLF